MAKYKPKFKKTLTPKNNMEELEKSLWGFNPNKAYAEYRNKLSGKMRSIENKGGGMYDGTAYYTKDEFLARAIEVKYNKGLAFVDDKEIAKLVVEYQAYGTFTKEQAAILQEHYNKTHEDKIDVKAARAKAAEISDFYKAEKGRLIKEGLTKKEAVEAAKKIISQVYFGSE